MNNSSRYEPPKEALSKTVYVNIESQKYHESEQCAGDSVPMSLKEGFYSHNPCRNCCVLYIEKGQQ